jgi:hypothetical protein
MLRIAPRQHLPLKRPVLGRRNARQATFTPEDFIGAIVTEAQYATEGEGPLDPQDRAGLLETIKRWRDALDQAEGIIREAMR